MSGLVDRREDNGDAKVTENDEWTVLLAVARSSQDYGWQRPTWTQELLVLVAEQHTPIRVSTTTLCRLLARHHARCGRPKPIVACPWSKHRKTRRLNELHRLRERLLPGEVLLYEDEADIHLNPPIGNDFRTRWSRQKSTLRICDARSNLRGSAWRQSAPLRVAAKRYFFPSARCCAKNSCKIAWHSPCRTPPSTVARWFSRGSLVI